MGDTLESWMVLALLVAAAVAALAFAARALSMSGALAAAAVGTLCMLAGWRWALLLVLYFLVSAAFSKFGADAKERRTGSIVAKAGRRDALQVLVNGGVFALAAFLSSRVEANAAILLAAAAGGALAASAADTLATELGTLVGGEPRSVITWRAVASGTSGGVTPAGTIALVGGALLIALLARALGVSTHVTAVALGGIAGAVADSLLGALVQERRRCPACDSATERRVHHCGTATELAGGVGGLDNDVVNLAATVVGAAVAATLVIA